MTHQLKKVLYVDDEEANLFLFETLFDEHFDIVTAISGSIALEVLRDKKGAYDWIITDLKMPEMDGFELLESVRLNYPNIKRVILTAFFENDQIKSALQSGLAVRCFRKLMDVDEMRAQLIEYID